MQVCSWGEICPVVFLFAADSGENFALKEMPERENSWVVYLLICSDGTLYTGITNCLQRRVETHNEGRGAKYTRGRLPVRLLRSFAVGKKGEALRMERQVKRLSRAEKLSLGSLDKWRTQ